MKSLMIAVTCMLFTVPVWAQETGGQSTTPPPQEQAGPMHRQMHHPGMMQEHMQEMKAQIDSMRAKVDQMKANLAKIKDSATKQQMQLDTELWDAMVTHLENMQKMMAEHPMGGMHGPHGPGGPPPASQQPAPPQ